jgi:molecular chaperone DnaK
MCGGRDFDRLLAESVVLPWVHNSFSVDGNFAGSSSRFRRMAEHAAEKVKIELSLKEEAIIAASEDELALKGDRPLKFTLTARFRVKSSTTSSRTFSKMR